MKYLKNKDTEKMIKNNETYTLEYDFQDNDINLAVAYINGRFPDNGYARNKECKEMVYVLEGSGTLYMKGQIIPFESGDAFLIDKNELYYYEAVCKLLLPCTPAWNISQHEIIESEN